MKKHHRLVFALLLVFLATAAVPTGTHAQVSEQTFSQTGKTVRGPFWSYWQNHGGLAQQGYPISNQFVEVNELNGQPYLVQYFERAVFELHTENANTPYEVLLSQLGMFQYRKKYPNGAPNQHVNTTNGRYFPETKHTVGGKFRTYWETHGGLAQQGYPISDEFQEKSDLNGKTYTVQYFERAVFELHPENQAPYDVLLSQLGTFRYKAKYGGPQQPTPVPTVGSVTGLECQNDCTDHLEIHQPGEVFYYYLPSGEGKYSFSLDNFGTPIPGEAVDGSDPVQWQVWSYERAQAHACTFIISQQDFAVTTDQNIDDCEVQWRFKVHINSYAIPGYKFDAIINTEGISDKLSLK